MIVAGLDLARRSDHSALVRLRSTAGGRWEVTHALRLPQISYGDQIAALRPALAGVERLAVDAGGVGDPVLEMLDGALPDGLRLLPVLITGGSTARLGEDGRWRAPKSLLVSALRGAMGMGRLTVAPNAIGREDLRSELSNFARLPTGEGRGARMEAATGHDDLVMALAIAHFATSIGTPSGVEPCPSTAPQTPTTTP